MRIHTATHKDVYIHTRTHKPVYIHRHTNMFTYIHGPTQKPVYIHSVTQSYIHTYTDLTYAERIPNYYQQLEEDLCMHACMYVCMYRHEDITCYFQGSIHVYAYMQKQNIHRKTHIQSYSRSYALTQTINIHTYTCTCTRAHMYFLRLGPNGTYVCVYMRTCTHACAPKQHSATCVHTNNIHIHAHTHINVKTYTHSYACIQTTIYIFTSMKKKKPFPVPCSNFCITLT